MTEVFEYLLMIRVSRILFKPTYKSIPTIRNIPVPVIAARTDDIFEFKAFISCKLSQFWFRVSSCLFLGISRMYLIAKPVSFTDHRGFHSDAQPASSPELSAGSHQKQKLPQYMLQHQKPPLRTRSQPRGSIRFRFGPTTLS